MDTKKTYENFPGWIVILSNLFSLAIYLLGFIIVFKLGLAFSLLYVLYILILEFRLLKNHCTNCFYWGKTCGFGKGRLSALFFKKGDISKFCIKDMTWKDIIPDFLVSLLPLLIGIILMIIKFDYILLSVLLMLLVLTTVGNGLIRAKFTCQFCKQRELGCPADSLLFKDELIEKKLRYKTNPTAWYSLHRSREISLFEHEKIVTPETSLGGNMTIDSVGYFHNTQVYTLIKDDSIKTSIIAWLAILNSSLLWFYLQNTGAVLRGGYFKFKTKYLEPFPLPTVDEETQQLLVSHVKNSLNQTGKLTSSINSLLKYLKSQFSMESFTKKLQSCYELEFSDFINEIRKNIETINKSRINNGLQPIVMPTKSDEMEWMELFETKKSEARSLKSEIEKTDKEIDQMVYELYDLSEEEIAIVESSNK